MNALINKHIGIIAHSGDASCTAEQHTRRAATRNTRKQSHDCEVRRGGKTQPVGSNERGRIAKSVGAARGFKPGSKSSLDPRLGILFVRGDPGSAQMSFAASSSRFEKSIALKPGEASALRIRTARVSSPRVDCSGGTAGATIRPLHRPNPAVNSDRLVPSPTIAKLQRSSVHWLGGQRLQLVRHEGCGETL